jgi:hypothetical protein
MLKGRQRPPGLLKQELWPPAELITGFLNNKRHDPMAMPFVYPAGEKLNLSALEYQEIGHYTQTAQ